MGQIKITLPNIVIKGGYGTPTICKMELFVAIALYITSPNIVIRDGSGAPPVFKMELFVTII